MPVPVAAKVTPPPLPLALTESLADIQAVSASLPVSASEAASATASGGIHTLARRVCTASGNNLNLRRDS